MNYCYDLFKGIYIRPVSNDTVRIGHCCVSDFEEIPIEDISIHNEHLEKNRKYYLDTGNLPEDVCKACIRQEKLGSESRRIRTNRSNNKNLTTDVELKHFDYNTYNVCNLVCITCNPGWSSAWKKDIDLIYGRPQESIKKTKNVSDIINVDFSTVEKVYFNGGEPLLNRDHIVIMQKLLSANNTKAVISYNSNGTQQITTEIIDLWKQMGKILFSISCDAIEKEFELIRWPAKWEQIEKTISHLKELKNQGLTIEIRLAANLGIHNLYSIVDLVNYAEKNDLKAAISPNSGNFGLKMLPIDCFTVELKEQIDVLNDPIAKNQILSLIKEIGIEENWKWVGILDRLDHMRDTSWRSTMHRLWNAIKHHNDSQYIKTRLLFGNHSIEIKSHLNNNKKSNK